MSYDCSIARKVRKISELKCKKEKMNLKKQGIKE